MVGRLRGYFQEFRYKNAGEVISHARKLAAEMGISERPIDEARLKKEVESLIASRHSFPHYPPLHALRALGAGARKISRHFEMETRGVTYVFKTTQQIVEGKPRGVRAVGYGKAMDKLGRMKFDSLEDLMETVGGISSEINQQPPRPKRVSRIVQITRKPRPSKYAGIEAIAPNFMTKAGLYDVGAIAEHLYGPREQLGEEAFGQRRKRLGSAISKLKAKGLIPTTVKPSSPVLRTPTPADVEKHVKLIHYVLKHGHTFLWRGWRHYLSYEKAVQHGKTGLAKAIERHDPEKGHFGPYAAMWIASQITKEVRTLARGASKTHSLDEEREGKRQAHEVIASKPLGVPESRLSADTLIKLHTDNQLSSAHLIVFTLKLMGHTLQEIGDHFGMTREGIRQLIKTAKKRINAASKE